MGGFQLENREHNPPIQIGVLPEGTALSPGDHLIIGRDADRAAFESFWGVTLGDNVVYINGAAGNAGIPIINGGEIWALVSPVGTLIDQSDIAASRNHSYHRAGLTTWEERSTAEAAPGTSANLPGAGLVVTQWSDAEGNGNFIYEFVQISYLP